MPECEVCGEQVEKISRCKSCGTSFCEDDGDPEEKLCIYCLEEGDNVDLDEPAEADEDEEEIDEEEDL